MSDDVKWYGKKLIDDAKVRLEKNMTAIGEYGVGEMKKYIQKGSKTGKIYFKRRGGKAGGHTGLYGPGMKEHFKTKAGWGALSNYIAHQASAEGESPASDMGKLANSMTYDVKRPTPMIYQVKIGTNMKIGFWLEYGTKFIKPRPFARRFIIEQEKKIMRMATVGLV
jgi:hypothetical protein